MMAKHQVPQVLQLQSREASSGIYSSTPSVFAEVLQRVTSS